MRGASTRCVLSERVLFSLSLFPTLRYSLLFVLVQRNNVRCTFPGCGAILRKGAAAAKQHWHCPDCGIAMNEADGAKHAALEHSDIQCPNGCGIALRLDPLRTHIEVRALPLPLLAAQSVPLPSQQ
jgi:hypothetical protein